MARYNLSRMNRTKKPITCVVFELAKTFVVLNRFGSSTVELAIPVSMPGWRQKLELPQHQTKRPRDGGLEQGQSFLSKKLLHLWGLGKLSAVAMQELALAAHQDGSEEEETQELAALGGHGQFPGNCHRDLLRLLQKKIQRGRLGGLKQSPQFSIKVPCIDSKEEDAHQEVDFHFFLPHLWVAGIFESYPDVAQHVFGLQHVKQFWKNVKNNDPRLKSSPVAWEKANRKEQWEQNKNLTIPLWLHGDGVEFSTDSLLVFSFGGVLCQPQGIGRKRNGLQESQGQRGLKQSQAIDHSFCLAAWPKSAQAKDTWTEIHQVLAWSFKSLWEGTHPKEDWKGRDLPQPMQKLAGKPITPEKYRFYVWQYLGDLEYFSNCMQFPHWQKDSFCWLCNCNRKTKGLSPWDWRDEPGWKMASGLEESQEESPSKHTLMNSIPGGLARFRPCLDVLHTIDLGVAPRLAGSVLHSWIYPNGCKEDNAAERLMHIWKDIKEAYQELNISERFTNLVLSMVVSDTRSPFSKPPILKGKAGEIRHLIPALTKVAWKKANQGEAFAHMAECLHALATFYDLLATSDFFMKQNEAKETFQAIKKCLRHCTWLKQHYNHGIKFKMTPKFHFAYHLGYQAQFENPKVSWTYKNESWVGSMAQIGHSVAHGCRAPRISKSFCNKYLLGYQLRINELE